MEPVIRLENLTKEFKVLNRHEGIKGAIGDLFSRDYKIVTAVNDVSLDIMPGEIIGYLGPNGAGKSTTIKMMSGVLEPTRGRVICNGMEPYRNRTQNAENIGVVFGQRSQLWWSLPAIESFRILRDIYQVSNADYQELMDLYATMVDMESILHKPVRQMSLGQRTLCDILAAFLHNPSVVYLDEPTIGLDVAMKAKIRELILMLNEQKKTTVILTTHDMGDVDALCRRIVIIDKGSKLYDNDIEHLSELFGKYRTLSLVLTGKSDAGNTELISRRLADVKAVLEERWPSSDFFEVSVSDFSIEILIDEKKASLMNVISAIQDKMKIYDIHIEEISTESVIRKIYGGGI